MGEPVKIRDMAEQMIRFYGFEPETDIKIEYVGLRPGERLDESLWGDDEEPSATAYSRILKVKRKNAASLDIHGILEKLKPVCCFNPQNPEPYRDFAMLRTILAEAIPSLSVKDHIPEAVHV
jgi:FlaA1/EpsC-like NDP-sugar epimerase